eukprot:TRINITY_DN5498_c0_g1_i2.p1 TRINITY_DN5498_c0_g1~~TRINITY_DN5498_c0_g1_i2.p1  ORF type:complete len:218 (+),score=52.91 TRINITY_DN5498_c0_g1_i2:348-1001(+)
MFLKRRNPFKKIEHEEKALKNRIRILEHSVDEMLHRYQSEKEENDKIISTFQKELSRANSSFSRIFRNLKPSDWENFNARIFDVHPQPSKEEAEPQDPAESFEQRAQGLKNSSPNSAQQDSFFAESNASKKRKRVEKLTTSTSSTLSSSGSPGKRTPLSTLPLSSSLLSSFRQRTLTTTTTRLPSTEKSSQVSFTEEKRLRIQTDDRNEKENTCADH